MYFFSLELCERWAVKDDGLVSCVGAERAEAAAL